MFKITVAALLTAAVVTGCQPKPVPSIVYRTRFFITGTYVYAEQTEFLYVWDTIRISRLPAEGIFHITRLTTYQRKNADISNDPEYQVEEFNGSYDPVHLKILLPGRTSDIEFKEEDPADFWIGNKPYSKIEY
jgi:hypothetical protein